MGQEESLPKTITVSVTSTKNKEKVKHREFIAKDTADLGRNFQQIVIDLFKDKTEIISELNKNWSTNLLQIRYIPTNAKCLMRHICNIGHMVQNKNDDYDFELILLNKDVGGGDDEKEFISVEYGFNAKRNYSKYKSTSKFSLRQYGNYPLNILVDDFHSCVVSMEWNKKNKPLYVDYINSAHTKVFGKSLSQVRDDSHKLIKDFDNEELQKGIQICGDYSYNNKIEYDSSEITCKYMMESGDISDCPIFLKMKYQYESTKENLHHFDNFNHYKHEYTSKEECKHHEHCYAFQRVNNNKYTINDLCHLKIYRHPPRTNRNAKLGANNSNIFSLNDNISENHDVYTPTTEDIILFDYDKVNGFIKALMTEVKTNGFAADLILNLANNLSILTIVDEKYNHPVNVLHDKLLNKAQILALILYTGSECNHDLCKTQRKNDYIKWKWFDFCLWNAIKQLSWVEKKKYNVYSGAANVKINQRFIPKAFFQTYVSSTYVKNIALSFIEGNNGIILDIDTDLIGNTHKFYCCDVSWISKFPDECEILIARCAHSVHSFSCEIMDEENGIQMVKVTGKDNHVINTDEFKYMIAGYKNDKNDSEPDDEDEKKKNIDVFDKSLTDDAFGFVNKRKIMDSGSGATTENWANAYGKKRISSDVYQWQIAVCNGGSGIMIGIVDVLSIKKNDAALHHYSNLTKSYENSYLYCNNGCIYNNGNKRHFGDVYGGGNVITVKLDMVNRCVLFAINDSKEQVAFEGIKQTEYVLAISSMFKANALEIVR